LPLPPLGPISLLSPYLRIRQPFAETPFDAATPCQLVPVLIKGSPATISPIVRRQALNVTPGFFCLTLHVWETAHCFINRDSIRWQSTDGTMLKCHVAVRGLS